MPWVAQATLDMMLADRAADRARYDALLDKYQSLKVAGAVEVPIPSTPAALPATQADEMMELIHAKAGRDYKLRGVMIQQLKQDRRDRLPEDQIAARIMAGIVSDGVPV